MVLFFACVPSTQFSPGVYTLDFMHSLDVRLNFNLLDILSLSCESGISLYRFFDKSLLLFVGEEGYSFPVALSHIIPVVVYPDCKTNKKLILKDNKAKAGIYR